MDRKIIIGLIIIVLIALAGLISFSSGIKSDTQINFLSGTNMKNGDQIQFELVDAQGNPLANQEVKITFKGSNETQNFTITTDDHGKGALILKDENSGNYSISVSFDGDDKHNGCSNKQPIRITDGTSKSSDNATYESSTESYSDSSSRSSAYSSDSGYSSQSSEGSGSSDIIESGQNKGLSQEYIDTHQPNIVDGSLE